MATSSQSPKPSAAPLHLRIFLASPGDVADERALALKVLERLPYDPLLRGNVTLEVVAWDKPGAGTPMRVTMTPQEAIKEGLPSPSECDIVVVIFWSRMGTPLPETEAWVKPEALRYLAGTAWESLNARYLSGTEWEYCDALQAAAAHGKPQVVVYRRTEKLSLDLEDPEFDEKRRQWQLVQAFFASFRNADGSLRRGYNEYTTPGDFAENLEHHLRSLVKEQLAAAEKTTAIPRSPAATAQPPLWQGSPFPGLRPFTDKETAIYFGRSRETDDLVQQLVKPEKRFIAVIGASGSGKSSLVWAGLIPRLQAGAFSGSQDWVWQRLTPGELGDNPFIALAAGFKSALEKQGKAPREVAEDLARDPGKLTRWVRLALEDKPDWAELLLFIDQFEELFTVVNPDYQDAFIRLLVHASRLAQVRTVVTMRADFYHRCVEPPLLAELLRTGSYPLAAPGIAALHEMITRPVERAGLVFEEGLVQRILEDTGTDPGALALMAFALAELYEAKTADGKLTHAAYESFQGVHGAIGKRAETAFNALEPSVQAQLGDIFRELVEVDDRGEATRRRALLELLTDSAEAKQLVNALTKARLLTTGQGEANEAVIEVAHEALFRSWPRLRDWIEKTRDDLRLRRQIAQAAAEWQARDRAASYRWPDERVVEAVDMLEHLGLDVEELSEVEQDFLGPLYPERMLKEIEDTTITHERRATIGVRLALLGDPRPGVGLREDGLPDIVWCAVPGGEVTLEIEEARRSWLARWLQRPASTTFTVGPFYIAKYPVTWVQYRTFLEAEDGFGNPAWWENLWFQVDKPGKQFNQYGNHPAENLCWLEAVAFCRWLSARLGYEIRLPTEWEWQQAATGGNPDNIYPWRAEWDDGCANTLESDLNRSTAVGMYSQGVSSVGALDMSGNVYDWCLNEYDHPGRTDVSGDGRRVVRGGSWAVSPGCARAAFRLGLDPVDRYYDVGLRVACLAPIS